MLRQLAPVLVALAAPVAVAKTPPRAPAPTFPETLDVVDYRLTNGLRVVLSPDHRAPTVGVALYFDAGTRDDPTGKAGLAHLVGHLLDDSHVRERVHDRGGETRAATLYDHTAFAAELPSSDLEWLLWADAQRLAAPHFDAPTIAREARRVADESLRGQTAAVAPLLEQLDALAFGKPAPTAAETERDLATVTVDDVKGYVHDHCVPRRAILAVAGDFAEKDARALVDKYFGVVPAVEGTAVAGPLDGTDATGETTKEATGETRDPLADAPAVLVGYHVPGARDADWHALDLLAAGLGAGEESRLVEDLVEKRKIASMVDAGIDLDFLRGPGLLDVAARAAAGHDLAELRRTLDEELDKARAGGLDGEELALAKARARARVLEALVTNRGRAERLAETTLVWGDPRQLRDAAKRYEAVRPVDVARVAKRYLATGNRAVLSVLPGERPVATGGGK